MVTEEDFSDYEEIGDDEVAAAKRNSIESKATSDAVIANPEGDNDFAILKDSVLFTEVSQVPLAKVSAAIDVHVVPNTRNSAMHALEGRELAEQAALDDLLTIILDIGWFTKGLSSFEHGFYKLPLALWLMRLGPHCLAES